MCLDIVCFVCLCVYFMCTCLYVCMCAFIIEEYEGNTDNIVWVPHTLNILQPSVRSTKSKKITRQTFQSSWQTILLQVKPLIKKIAGKNINKTSGWRHGENIKAVRTPRVKILPRRELWRGKHRNEQLSSSKHLLIHKQWPKGWATEWSNGD